MKIKSKWGPEGKMQGGIPCQAFYRTEAEDHGAERDANLEVDAEQERDT